MCVPMSEGRYSIAYVLKPYADESCEQSSLVTDDEWINSLIDSISREYMSELFISSFRVWIKGFNRDGEWRVFSEGTFEYFGNNSEDNCEFNVHPNSIKFCEINENKFGLGLEMINWNIDKSMDSFYNREVTSRRIEEDGGGIISRSRREFHCDTKYSNGEFCPEKPIHLLDIGNDKQISLCQTCAFDFLMKEHLDRLRDF